MSVLACVDVEPTWEELKDQLMVAVDALSVSLPPTSSAQVTAQDLDQIFTKIKEDAYEHAFHRGGEHPDIFVEKNVKKLGVIVYVRLLQTCTSCGWLWNASHVVIPLLNDTGLPLGAEACKDCLPHFNLAV